MRPFCFVAVHVQHKLEDAVQLTVGNDAFMLFSYDKVGPRILHVGQVMM